MNMLWYWNFQVLNKRQYLYVTQQEEKIYMPIRKKKIYYISIIIILNRQKCDFEVTPGTCLGYYSIINLLVNNEFK